MSPIQSPRKSGKSRKRKRKDDSSEYQSGSQQRKSFLSGLSKLHILWCRGQHYYDAFYVKGWTWNKHAFNNSMWWAWQYIGSNWARICLTVMWSTVETECIRKLTETRGLKCYLLEAQLWKEQYKEAAFLDSWHFVCESVYWVVRLRQTTEPCSCQNGCVWGPRSVIPN